MAALHELKLDRWQAEAVLLPEGKGVRVTVYGDWLPMRAIEPEILVGEARAQRVRIARDMRSVHGYFRDPPPRGSRVLVRYGDSQEGTVAEPFDPARIRPLPAECC
jgi:hypothetical protein